MANNEKNMDKNFAYGLVSAAYFFGGASMFAFGVFLFTGSFHFFNFGFDQITILLMDAGLSLLFFIQHSVMIRKIFRRNVEKFLPKVYYPAVYTIASGAVLLILLIFWQKSSWVVGAAGGFYHWLLRILFFTAVPGFVWGMMALDYFDPFGIRQILLQMRNKSFKTVPIIVKGPFKMVRHPLYFFALIAIWTAPVLTADRLLFNILWTIWIVIGATLEEKDLIEEFGDDYIEYRKKVPMLLPIRLPRDYDFLEEKSK